MVLSARLRSSEVVGQRLTIWKTTYRWAPFASCPPRRTSRHPSTCSRFGPCWDRQKTGRWLKNRSFMKYADSKNSPDISLPVPLSRALTLTIPLASISKVTSTCGTPRGAGGIPPSYNFSFKYWFIDVISIKQDVPGSYPTTCSRRPFHAHPGRFWFRPGSGRRRQWSKLFVS